MNIYDKLFPKGFYDGSDESRRFILINEFYWRRNRRRERLLKKWEKTYYFKKQSVSGTWEVEFMSLVPEDDKWHHVSASVMAWVKKDKISKKSEATQYLDGVKIANITLAKSNIKEK